MAQVHTKEFLELLATFERFKLGGRYDKEPRESWPRGDVYQDGETNQRFRMFHSGYEHGKAVERLQHA